MSANLWKVGTTNAFSTTLNGSVLAGATSIVLTSTTGLQSPGVLVIDRVDSNGTSTPTTREYISYTGISTNTLTGVSKGLGGSTDQAHSSGATVEEVWSISHWNDFLDTFAVSHDSAGKIVSTSTATLTNIRLLTNLAASGASGVISDLSVPRFFNASGASITGNFPITPTWVIGGAISLATTSVGKPIPMPQSGTWAFFSAMVRTPVSGASLLIDINKNGTSIFTDQNTRIYIPGGGTFVSTASIGTKTYAAADAISVDIDAGGGSASDLTVVARGLNI